MAPVTDTTKQIGATRTINKLTYKEIKKGGGWEKNMSKLHSRTHVQIARLRR
jgi:hypothetical protein